MQWFRVRVTWRDVASDGEVKWCTMKDEIQGETYNDAVKNAWQNWQGAYGIIVLPGGGR